MEKILSIQSLCKTYGAKKAVDAIAFDIAPGEIVGLLGPNGAGKTTTISMILGVLTPTSGHIVIGGTDIAKDRSKALEATNFSAVYAPLPGNLTVEENLRFFAAVYGVRKPKDRIDTLLSRFDLEKFRKTRTGLLSSGEMARVSLAKAMINSPRLLLLDEPTASLDPATARDIRDHIRGFAAEGHGGVLWTSHNMYEVEDVCHRVLFLSQGKILLEGDPRTLPAQYNHKTLEDLFVSVAREPLSLENAA